MNLARSLVLGRLPSLLEEFLSTSPVQVDVDERFVRALRLIRTHFAEEHHDKIIAVLSALEGIAAPAIHPQAACFLACVANPNAHQYEIGLPILMFNIDQRYAIGWQAGRTSFSVGNHAPDGGNRAVTPDEIRQWGRDAIAAIPTMADADFHVLCGALPHLIAPPAHLLM